jgi:hypothetical protein
VLKSTEDAHLRKMTRPVSIFVALGLWYARLVEPRRPELL